MNRIQIPVDDPEALLVEFGAGALIRVEKSSAGGGVGFAEIGTVPLVASTTIYNYDHSAGITGDWYRARYSNAGNTLQSDYGAEIQGGVDAAYASLAAVKQRMGIKFLPDGVTLDIADDEVLLDLIAEVTQWINTYTGRTFLPDPPTGTKIYLFDGFEADENGRLLTIPTGIRSITLLELAYYSGGAFSTIPSTDYFLRPHAQDRDPGWPASELWMTDIPSSGNPQPMFTRGLDNIRITGTFGWAAIPKDIEDVTIRIVIDAFIARGNLGQAGNAVLGQQAVAGHVSDIDQRVLSRYRYDSIEII